MATQAQIQANRLNAMQSTGPTSEAGKAASRFNALKHGMDAKSLTIPGEDPAELEALTLDYHRRFRPDGPLEAFFVETIVKADWDRRRYARIEAQYLRVQFAALEEPTDVPLGVIFGNDAKKGNVLQKLFRRQSAAERSYFRALAELRRAQRERLLEEMEQAESEMPLAVPAPAAALVGPHAAKPLESASIGFVPPDSQALSAAGRKPHFAAGDRAPLR
ncbi:MAG: hypothetical protein ABSC23_06370 [Bryobacteraceae bacterium]|jgi:hypothetical protein